MNESEHLCCRSTQAQATAAFQENLSPLNTSTISYKDKIP